MGLPDEVRELLERLPGIAEVVSVRGPYQNRERGRSCGLPDKTVRVFADVRLVPRDEPDEPGYSHRHEGG